MKQSGAVLKNFIIILLMLVACGHGRRGGLQQPATALASCDLLATGAPIHGANGLTFSESGELYVASRIGDEILMLDPDTGELISTVGANQGVVDPGDIVIGPDGSLYWTSSSTGEVANLRPDGTSGAQMLMPGVNGITFSDDGRLFVSITFKGDALYELDPQLSGPPRLVVASPGLLNDLAWGPDGFLYGPLMSRGEIVRVDVETGDIKVVAEGIDLPAAAKFDPEGRLFAIDHASGEVFKIDVGTGDKALLATLTPGLDNLACDSAGRLFVSHAQDGCICEILSDGSKHYIWPGGMIAPGGVAVLTRPDGESVFVADLWTLREFDGESGELRTVHRHMPELRKGITTPFTVAADGARLILTSYILEDAVQVYDPGTREVVLDIRDLKSPLSAIRFQGDLIVAEHGTNSVIRISEENPKERSTLARGLGVPTGLAATESDLWVCDQATGLVLQLVEGSQIMDEPRVIAQGLSYPEGLAVDLDGTLLVREGQTGCLRRVDPASGKVTTVAEDLPPCLQGEHPTWIFNGVAVGSSGVVYLTCDATNSLHRILPVQ